MFNLEGLSHHLEFGNNIKNYDGFLVSMLQKKVIRGSSNHHFSNGTTFSQTKVGATAKKSG
jgi:hypothetical protein